MKLSIADFPKVSGDICDQELFQSTVKVFVGMPIYVYLLEHDPNTLVEKVQDKELFDLLQLFLMEEKVSSIITNWVNDSNRNLLEQSR